MEPGPAEEEKKGISAGQKAEETDRAYMRAVAKLPEDLRPRFVALKTVLVQPQRESD